LQRERRIAEAMSRFGIPGGALLAALVSDTSSTVALFDSALREVCTNQRGSGASGDEVGDSGEPGLGRAALGAGDGGRPGGLHNSGGEAGGERSGGAGRASGGSGVAGLGGVPRDSMGLDGVFTGPGGEERRRVAERVLQSGVPVRLSVMVGGVFCLVTFRALPECGGGSALLVVAQRHNETTPRDGGGDVEVLRARHDDLGELRSLTEREMEVLRLIGLGLSGEAIAETLQRSRRTVQGHRLSLGNKLRMSNRVELARLAVSSGLTALAPEELRLMCRQARLSPAARAT